MSWYAQDGASLPCPAPRPPVGRLLPRDPPGRFKPDRRVPDDPCELLLKAGQLGLAEIVFPPASQVVEERLTLAHDLGAERRHLEPLAAGVAGVRLAGDVASLEEGLDDPRGTLLGQRSGRPI